MLNSGILPSSQATDVDRRQVRASLENAWRTELLHTLEEHIVRDEEVIRLSNNWNVVQAYYAPEFTAKPVREWLAHTGCGTFVHRTRQSIGEQLCGVVYRQTKRRVAQRRNYKK